MYVYILECNGHAPENFIEEKEAYARQEELAQAGLTSQLYQLRTVKAPVRWLPAQGGLT
jgi:hypothetical protein